MGINTYEVMYIQARDNYPYNVEECIEKLQYVIAGDSEHAGAHCLMGQIYEDQLRDYVQAVHYYEMALYLDKNLIEVYYHYAGLLIKLDRMERAHAIIERGLKVPGADIGLITYQKGLLYEKYEMYSTATELYNEAKRLCLNNSFMQAMDEQIKRVKDKKALLKKLSKKKPSKSSKTKTAK
jgi:tetratricopeptide (TPR) repeat protein